MAGPFEFDRTWTFETSAADLWRSLTRTEHYTRWWPWLRECDVDGVEGTALTRGAVARCVVRAALPYTLRFEIEVEEVRPARLLVAGVRGDLRGPARLELHDDGARCHARLAWAVHVEDPMLRALARFARPAMVWAHDRVVEAGVRDFRAAALGGR